jgi:hypothetical protein
VNGNSWPEQDLEGSVVGDAVRSGAGNEDPPGAFTEQDLLLGKKASTFMDVVCVIAFVACIGIAVFVFINVPWNTRMPYDGKYNRSGTGIPMQIAMLPCLLVLFGLWRSGRKPDAHHMRKGGRVGVYVFGTAMILACAVGQWVMGQAILTEGGYFPG